VENVSDQIWSFEKSCLGDERDGGGLGPIKRSTSLGYHEGFEGCTSNQKKCFSFITESGMEEWNFDHPDAKWIRNRSDEILYRAREGYVPNEIFTLIMKDERKTYGKLGRVFFGSPMAILTATRCAWGSLISYLNIQGFEGGTLIGFNPYQEAQGLYDFMQFKNKGERMIDGDYKFYDQSLAPILVFSFRFIGRMYYIGCPEQDHIMREAILLSFLSAIVYLEKKVDRTPEEEETLSAYVYLLCQLFGINPSGEPATTHINCFVGILALVVSFVSILLMERMHITSFEYTGTPQQKSLITEVIEGTRIVVLGDDNLINVGDFGFEFNQLSTELAKLGLTYTPADKGSEGYTTKNISQISILGRTFEYNSKKCRMVLKLREVTLIDMPCWVREKSKEPLQEKAICEEVLKEYSLYGELKFNIIRDKLVAAYNVAFPHYPALSNIDWSDTFDQIIMDMCDFRVF